VQARREAGAARLPVRARQQLLWTRRRTDEVEGRQLRHPRLRLHLHPRSGDALRQLHDVEDSSRHRADAGAAGLCPDARPAKETWRYDLGDGLVPRVLPHPTVFAWDFKGPKPALADGVVYVGAGDGSFHAVDATTGKRVWRFTPPAKTSTLDVVGESVSNVGK